MIDDDPTWWRDAVVYQTYIRSFADGDGDGTGDLAGMIARLDHLVDLGVDAVWVNPWYASPLRDGGYDVADYRRIDPRYGTLDAAERFIGAAHDAGLRVLADLVPNHTSSDHAWFREAVSSPPGHPSRARYHIRPGRGPGGDEPPNDWIAVFGGPAWERLADGEWYLHLFDVSQPDLDWNHPEVRAEFLDILRFWLDRGIDGFRVDVAHGLAKDPDYADVGSTSQALAAIKPGNHPHWDRDELHEIVREWRALVDTYPGSRLLVAEAWTVPDRRALYLRPDEYHQAFDFSFLGAGWDASALRRAIDESLASTTAVGSVPTWVLSNHDVVRHPTRFGLPHDCNWRGWLLDGPHDLLDAELGSRRARAALLLMLALPGSVYLYQGEELGLHEVWDLPVEVLDDPVWTLSGQRAKGRDGCRVPIPWTRDGTSFGFGADGSWLPQPAHWGSISVDAQRDDPASMLSLHRQAIAARRGLFGGEAWSWLEVDGGAEVLAFDRGGVVCVVNLGARPVALPDGDVVVSSDLDGPEGSLAPDAAAWVRTRSS